MDNGAAIEVKMGCAVRELRLGKGWSQEQLSFESGLHRTYIGAVERGEKNLTVKNLARIADALGVTASIVLAMAGF